MAMVLSALKGPDQGRRFEVPDNEPQQIGRSSESLPLTDRTISRRHAELTPDNGDWYINDLHSANGTYVNGVLVTEPRRLHVGDQIRVGMSLLLFGDEPYEASTSVRMVGRSEIDISVEYTAMSSDESMIMAVPDPAAAAQFQLDVVYELTALIGSATDRQELLEKVMDVIFGYFKADRGFILLQDDTEHDPKPIVVRHRKRSEGKQVSESTISRTIVRYVTRKGIGVLSANAMNDVRFASGDSVQSYGIRSAMCAPIRYKDRMFGVIHLDSQVKNYTHTEDQLQLLTAIGVHTGLALANAHLYDQRLRQERLAGVGQTVASLSHSIKNILQGMRGGADVVDLGLKKNSMAVVHNGWQIVARNQQRIYELAMNMLAYSAQRQPELEMVNLPQLLDEAVLLIQKQFDTKKVAMITDFAADLPPIPVDSSGIHQAVLNLLSNGLDAVEPETGAVTLRCEFDTDRQQVLIRVMDNGAGMTEANQQRLFEPFYSTKGYRGTGLGLVVTRKIIAEHDGTVQVESKPGEGTMFLISLPLDVGARGASAETLGP